MMTTFGLERDGDPDDESRFRALIAPGRAWAAFDGATMVATAASHTLRVGIPGGVVPMAGLTMVTVRPTHRRRGILRELIALHLADASARGEAASALWASEATIYGRFGYGVATEADALELDTRGLTITAAAVDALEWLDEATARPLLPAIYATAIAGRPGALHRSPTWWRERGFLDASLMREGASRRRHVLARRGADATGYVVYRQSAGRTQIVELMAVDARAEATLWRFVTGIDLFPTAAWETAPIDSALPWLASDRRRVTRKRHDALWLRIGDVPAALAARRYARDGELVLGVDGTSWQLAIARGRATCTPTDAAPEVRLDRAALGSLYLGGMPASLLARGGLIAGGAERVALAEELFGWPVAPWCAEQF